MLGGSSSTRRRLPKRSDSSSGNARRSNSPRAGTTSAVPTTGVDYYHGAKSAGKVVALGLHEGIDPLVYETALFAVTHHCGSEPHAEDAACHVRYFVDLGDGGEWIPRFVDAADVMSVFLTLKDADALDRVRLGDLNMSYMHTDAGTRHGRSRLGAPARDPHSAREPPQPFHDPTRPERFWRYAPCERLSSPTSTASHR